MPRKYFSWTLALVFVLLFLSIYFTKNQRTQVENTPQQTGQAAPSGEEKQNFQVSRVIDGDTIEVNGNLKVRYIGVDTPETGDCFGEEAKKANENLVGDKSVRLEYDVQRIDKYGRTLAYVYVDEVFVNEKLIQDGFAKVATFPPNVLNINNFTEAERFARDKKLGLWSQNACT